MQAITKFRNSEASAREFSAGEPVFSLEHNMQGRVLGVIRPAGVYIVGFGARGSAGLGAESLRPVVRAGNWFERFTRKAA